MFVTNITSNSFNTSTPSVIRSISNKFALILLLLHLKTVFLDPYWPRSTMDSIRVSEAPDSGSIPDEATTNHFLPHSTLSFPFYHKLKIFNTKQ